MIVRLHTIPTDGVFSTTSDQEPGRNNTVSTQKAPQGNTRAAYEQIRQAIVEGRYPPGQRLIEQRIAEEFSLSRTPVREALRRLEAEGLVLSEPNRGAIVRSMSTDDVADLYGLRARLEAYGAELAAVRNQEADIERLDAGITDFERALKGTFADPLDQVRAVDAANREIHHAILGAARHERLSQLLERTVDVPLVFQAFRHFEPTETERSHLFHQLLRDAIVAGDAQRASALMYEHVLQGRDVLVAHIEANGSEVGDLFATASAGEDSRTS